MPSSGVDYTRGVPVFEDGVAVYQDYVGETTPGVEQTLVAATVPVGKTWTLRQAIVPCRQPGIFTIDVDGDIVGSGRTGANAQNAKLQWLPPRPALGGQVVTLKFTARAGVPISALEGYLMALEK